MLCTTRGSGKYIRGIKMNTNERYTMLAAPKSNKPTKGECKRLTLGE